MGEGEPTIPDGILRVDFQELDLPINQTEEIQVLQFKLDNNVISVLDLIKSDNPDMDNEAAEDKLLENKKFNDSLSVVDKARQDLAGRGVIIDEGE